MEQTTTENTLPLSNMVVDYIIREISTGKYKIGDRLPSERDISKQLSISRATLREAFRVLNYLGFVSSEQGSGNYVSDKYETTVAKLMDTMFHMGRIRNTDINVFRKSLELQAMELAMDKITPEKILEMRKTAELMERTDDEKMFVILDNRLHMILITESQNPLIRVNYQALSSVNGEFMAQFCFRNMQNKNGFPKLSEYHFRIVEALEKKDLPMGLQAIQDHFNWIY